MTEPKPYPADLYPGCPCYACDQAPRIAAARTLLDRLPNRMSLCPTCGDKRCLGADHHDRHDARDTIQAVGGTLRTHPEGACAGEFCCVHNPSDHPLNKAPMHWRGFMERICPHGIGHPDPDDRNAPDTHGCDGCCHREAP